MDTIGFDIAIDVLETLTKRLRHCRDLELIRETAAVLKTAIKQIENSISMEIPKACPKCQAKTTPGAPYCAFCGNRVVRDEGGEADCS